MIHFGFPINSDDAIVINYYILYVKYYMYVGKGKENNENSM